MIEFQGGAMNVALVPRNLYRPTHLRRWEKIATYEGPDWTAWYEVCEMVSRPAAKSKSNYLAAEHQIRLQTPARLHHLIINAKFTDHYSGWRRKLMIHESCAPALRVADEIAEQLERHDVLDPEGYKHRLLKEVRYAWSKMLLGLKIQVCWEAGISIFVARRKQFPSDEREIAEALTEAMRRD